MSFEYHVSRQGSDFNSGSADAPFLTINRAAGIAQAGDTVTVHEGVYREWVCPLNPGVSDSRRVVYQAAENEKVVIKGSEEVKNWERVEGTVWKAVLPNSLFGGFNPYAEEIDGDWIMSRPRQITHLGDVYLNGRSFFEAGSKDALFHPMKHDTIQDFMTGETVPDPYSEQRLYLWFAEVDEARTVIYANFHDADPNRELVEVNVRKCCFFPRRTGIDYITVRGFEMAQAACPWAPPTADQPGLLGTNWSKGWIIENNVIHDAKCSGISIGKEGSTGDNYCTRRQDKPGYQYQLESVFEARRAGWSREKIGSHIIRHNTIYDCGQNGIVGHLGCVFSEIHHNHIYSISTKREFYGWEIAGIKLHAAIDVQIHHNRIHRCALGTWLDWQAQGARVSHNLYYDNNRDFFVEVSHGPYLVEHNIMASPCGVDSFSQGGAYVNNLIAGTVRQQKVLNRATPYHLPHSTAVKGYAFVYGGDDRLYSNIFIGSGGDGDYGTAVYNRWNFTASLEEYIRQVQVNAPGDLENFEKVEQPVYIENNVYLNKAGSYRKESGKLELSGFDPGLKIREEGDAVYLSITLPPEFDGFTGKIHSTKTLGRVRIADAEFEAKDGGPLVLDMDYCGEKKSREETAGPIAKLKAGKNNVRVW